MQDVAREMNLSETAFVLPHEDGYDLRWFTPTAEVDLCGHATLAAAHVLWESGVLGRDAEAVFHTRSGLLRATIAGGWIEMDFPAKPVESVDPPRQLMDALGVEPVFVGRNDSDYLVALDDEKVLRTMRPNISLLEKVDMRGVIVTTPAISGRFDFASRFFAPAVGVNEDPVTGSAHCALAPYWSDRLGKQEMVGYQVSSRGGTVRTRMAGDRVILGGQAVTVLRAELI